MEKAIAIAIGLGTISWVEKAIAIAIGLGTISWVVLTFVQLACDLWVTRKRNKSDT